MLRLTHLSLNSEFARHRENAYLKTSEVKWSGQQNKQLVISRVPEIAKLQSLQSAALKFPQAQSSNASAKPTAHPFSSISVPYEVLKDVGLSTLQWMQTKVYSYVLQQPNRRMAFLSEFQAYTSATSCFESVSVRFLLILETIPVDHLWPVYPPITLDAVRRY